MYFDDLWIGFLCEQILRQITQLSIIRCPGCEQKHKSAIFHQHEQHSLLDKVRLYFEEIRGSIIPTVCQLYIQVEQKLPHSDDLANDRECYISIGRQFMLTITADALYYGRYINEFMDGLIDDAIKIERATKKRKTKEANKTSLQKFNNGK